jgi:malate dehydrogenase (oxaloacetate-decarboxylating)
MDYNKESLEMHKEKKGKLELKSKVKIETKDDLSIAYTPGVAQPCRVIAKDESKVYDYTIKSNTVAIVSDGSAVLGLGNIGPKAAIPVMEGKAILLKEFANVDAFPICLDTQDTTEIIETVKRIAPVFGGINLEDISAPRCFEIEKRLQEELDIPVFHDDQHGTAIVVLAGLINALKLTDKKIEDTKIILNGAGAAGIAIANLLYKAGAKDMLMCDSKGIIVKGRDNLNEAKEKVLKFTNLNNLTGDLSTAMVGADVFIGISKGNLLTKEMVKTMNEKPMIFAMANPTPEIMPEDAKDAGAFIVATGRSDFPNQINNVLAFPGIFRGLLDNRINKVTNEIKLSVAKAIAEYVDDLSVEKIVPNALDKGVASVVAKAVKDTV